MGGTIVKDLRHRDILNQVAGDELHDTHIVSLPFSIFPSDELVVLQDERGLPHPAVLSLVDGQGPMQLSMDPERNVGRSNTDGVRPVRVRP